MMLPSAVWENMVFLVGEITLVLIFGFLILSLIVVALAFYSIRKGYFIFPQLVKSGIVITEGMAKGICKLLGLDDREFVAFSIRLHNAMNQPEFEKIPIKERAVFIPHCLRSQKCPAHLTSEGIICLRCGRCEIGSHIDELEGMGYRVWISPGSTLVKRMVKKYKPKAAIGVGCLLEVHDGLELLDKAKIVGMGVISLKDGCVETVLNWQDLLDVAAISNEEK